MKLKKKKREFDKQRGGRSDSSSCISLYVNSNTMELPAVVVLSQYKTRLCPTLLKAELYYQKKGTQERIITVKNMFRILPNGSMEQYGQLSQ